MFKKTQRFSFGKGVPKNKFVTPLYVLRFQKTETPTYAVVVSKSVSKKATQRNKIKRLFITELQKILKTTTLSMDMVFFLRRNFQEYTKSGIISELKFTISKIHA